MKRALVLAFALALAACGTNELQKSDWEIQNQDRLAREAVDRESVTQFPPAPRAANLKAFEVEGSGAFRFYVDAASISLAPGGVVRYTMVARSGSGAENVSYEGARCPTGEHRTYAVMSGGAWRATSAPWRAMSQPWDVTLHREYFCAQGVPIRNVPEGVRALEQGGHPFYKGFAADPVPRR